MSTGSMLIERLKRLIKAKGLTYAVLANRIEVSESTLKRWFASKNMSIKRLDEVCKGAGITLDDLMRESLDKPVQNYFTQEQEVLFTSDEKLLVVYYLVALGRPFNEITNLYQYTHADLQSYCLKLEKVGLIELHPKDKVVPLVNPSTMWRPRGLLNQKYFKYVREDFMNSHFTDHNEIQNFVSGRLSEAGLQLIKKKLEKMTKEIHEIYQLDANNMEAENASTLIAMRPWRFSLVKKYLKK